MVMSSRQDLGGLFLVYMKVTKLSSDLALNNEQKENDVRHDDVMCT